MGTSQQTKESDGNKTHQGGGDMQTGCITQAIVNECLHNTADAQM